MIALWVLFFIVLAILVASFLANGRKVLSPSFIFNLTFLASISFALVGNSAFWGEDVSLGIVAILGASIMLFNIGEYVSRLLVGRKRRRNGISPTEIESSSDSENERRINQNLASRATVIVCVLLFLFGIGICALQLFYEVRILQELGYSVSFGGFFEHLREAFLNGAKLPFFVSRLGEVVEGIGLTSIFVFHYALFNLKKRIGSLSFLLLQLPCLGVMLLSSSRVGFILFIVCHIIALLFSASRSKIRISPHKIIGIVAILLAVFSVTFVIIGLMRGSIKGLSAISENILYYFGGSVVAFDKYLRTFGQTQNSVFGAESFSGVYETLGRLFSGVPEGIHFDAFVHFANGQSTNVYSIFKSFVADFGIVPNFFLSLLLGFAYGAVFQVVKSKKKGFSFWYIYYAILIYYLILSVVSKQATATLFTWRRISYILATFIVSQGVRLLLYGKEDFKILNRLKKSNSAKVNLAVSIFAQAIVLISSLFVSLFYPKVMSREVDFASWQYFVLLSGFVGVFHFGFCDGLYLRLGGKEESDLKGERLRAHMVHLTLLELLIAAGIIIIGVLLAHFGNDKGPIVVCVGAYLVVYNLFTFAGYVFQATGQIKKYSLALIINKSLFVVGSVALLVLKVSSYIPYVVVFIGSTLIGLAVLLFFGRGFFFAKEEGTSASQYVKEFWSITGKGIWIMVGSLSSSLILGSAKYIAEWRWGAATFSDFAYCFTLVALFMTFINQLCVVLFPVLRRKKTQDVAEIKTTMDRTISVVAPVLIVLYYPLAFLIQLWLPQYQNSVTYLGLVLPVVIFEIKTQVLCATNFKVLEREKTYFVINVVAFGLSVALGSCAAFLLSNVLMLAFAACIGIVFQSIIGQIVTSKITKTKISPFIIADLFLFAVFALANYYLPWWAGLLITVGYVSIVLGVAHKQTKLVLSSMRKSIRTKQSTEKGEPREAVMNQLVDQQALEDGEGER